MLQKKKKKHEGKTVHVSTLNALSSQCGLGWVAKSKDIALKEKTKKTE